MNKAYPNMSLYDLILDKVKPWLPIRVFNCVVDNVFQLRSGTLTPGFVLTLVDASGTAQWAAGGGGGGVTSVSSGTPTSLTVATGATTPVISTTGNFGSQDLTTSGRLTVTSGLASTIGGILNATGELLANGNTVIQPGTAIPPDGAYLRSNSASGTGGTLVWDSATVPASFVTNLTRSNVAITIGGSSPYPVGTGVLTVGFTGDCTGVSLTNAVLYANAGVTASTAGHKAVFTSLTVNNSLAAPKVPAAGDYLQAANASGDCKWVTVSPGTVTQVLPGTGIGVINQTTTPTVSFAGGALGAVGFDTSGNVHILSGGNLVVFRPVVNSGWFATSRDGLGSLGWSDPTTVCVTSLAQPLGDTSITLSQNAGDISISASGLFGSRPLNTTGGVSCGHLQTNGGDADLGTGSLLGASTATINPGAGFSTGLILPNGAGNGLFLQCGNTGATTWVAAPAGAVSSVTAADGTIATVPPGGTGAVTVAATGAFGSKNISTSGTLGVIGASTMGTVNCTGLTCSGVTTMGGDLITSGGITMTNSVKNLSVAGAGSVALAFNCGSLEAGLGGPTNDVFTYFTPAAGVGLRVGGGPLLAAFSSGGPAQAWNANASVINGSNPNVPPGDLTLTAAQICSSIIKVAWDGPIVGPPLPANPTWTLPTYAQVCSYLQGTRGIQLFTGLTWECRMISPSRSLSGAPGTLAVYNVQEDPVDAISNFWTEGLRFMRSGPGQASWQYGRTNYAWVAEPNPGSGTNYQVAKSFWFTFTNFVSTTHGLIEVVI